MPPKRSLWTAGLFGLGFLSLVAVGSNLYYHNMTKFMTKSFNMTRHDRNHYLNPFLKAQNQNQYRSTLNTLKIAEEAKIAGLNQKLMAAKTDQEKRQLRKELQEVQQSLKTKSRALLVIDHYLAEQKAREQARVEARQEEFTRKSKIPPLRKTPSALPPQPPPPITVALTGVTEKDQKKDESEEPESDNSESDDGDGNSVDDFV